MLHRTQEASSDGLGLEELRQGLEWMRTDGHFRTVPLADFFTADGPALRAGTKAVAFTIDDGYRDQFDLMGPVFAQFDVPVTLFATTDFVDGQLWMWWDRIHYAIERCGLPRATFTLPHSGALVLDITPDRRASADQLIERLKRVPDADRLAALEQLAAATEVDVPRSAPEMYSAAPWDTLRSWESRGIYSIAPHTVTHPVLSRLDDASARTEIFGSWTRLQRELKAPAPVFCFPNGKADDFGAREMRLIDEAGLLGAVSVEPGAVRKRRVPGAGPLLLPRYNYPDSLTSLRVLLSGISELRG